MNGTPSSGDRPLHPSDESLASTQFLLRSLGQRDSAARNALRQIKVRRPIDLLVDRLEQADGPAWFEAGFSENPLELLGGAEAILEGGPITVEACRLVKNKAKRLHKRGVEAAELEFRQRGLCGYFIAIAAALIHHRVLLSSLPRIELRDILFELASAAPGPWSEFLEKAADVEGWTRQ